MGLTPGWGGGSRLLRIVGKPQVALRLLAGSEKCDWKKGLEYGLVDRVSREGEDILEVTKQFLSPYIYYSDTDIGTTNTKTSMRSHLSPSQLNPPHAIRSMKQLIVNHENTPLLQDQLAFEREIFIKAWGAEDNRLVVSNRPKSEQTPSSSSGPTNQS